MSSAMITKLVMLNKGCKAQGVKLKLCEVSPNVMEVFKITKLNKLIVDRNHGIDLVKSNSWTVRHVG
jgi:anti-anti-sigma regulatory factor